jgi:hypothetical protein
MARLNWENVAAPDFSGSAQGIRDAAAMINQALSGAQTGLARFEGIQDDRVNKDFAMDLLKYQDPESYKAALNSGALFERPGANRLSGEMITAAGSRVGALLNQSQTEFQMGRDKRIDAQSLALDAVAPVIGQVRTLLSQNKEAEANALLAQNPELYKGLGARDILSVVDGNNGALRDGLGIVSTRQSIDQSGQRFNWEVEGRADAKIEKTAFDQLVGMYDKADQAAALQNMKLPAGSKAALWQQLGLPQAQDQSAFDEGSIGGFGSAAGPGVAGADRIMNYEARDSGFGSVPANVKTLGQASDFALKVNEANKARTGKPGSSAMGLYQIVGQTMRNVAPDALGADWRNQPFNAENQYKIAAKIFEDNRGSADALRKQWVSLSPAEAERVRKMPTREALDIISRKESGGVASQFIGQKVDAALRGNNAAEEYGTLSVNNNAEVFAAQQDDSKFPIATIIANLKKSSFPDATNASLLTRIRQVQAQAKNTKYEGPDGKMRTGFVLSDRNAADFLARSVKPAGFGDRVAESFDSINPWATGKLGGGLVTDPKMLKDFIANALPSRNSDGTYSSTNETVIKGRTAIAGQAEVGLLAQQVLAQTQQEIAKVRAAINAGRQVNPRLINSLLERQAQAQAAIEGAQNALKEEPAQRGPSNVWPDNAASVVRARRQQQAQPAPQGWSLRR